GRRSDVLRGAVGGAVPVRLLPDAAADRVPARRQAPLGTRAAAGRRAGASRPESGSAVRPVAARVVRGPRWPPAAPAGEAVRSVRAEWTAAYSSDRVRLRAAAALRRSDADPIPRRLSSSFPRAVLPRVGAGAAVRQPRPAARRSVHRL